MAKSVKDILSFLICPACQGGLELDDNHLSCSSCRQSYEIIKERPILFADQKKGKDVKFSPPKSKIKDFGDKLMVQWIDKSSFDFINQLKEDAKILNLGSGGGMFDKLIKKEMVNLDIDLNDYTDIVADGHKLPLKTGYFDCVFSQAVLEHVARPWEVAEEIYRVLKPSGYVVIGTPFLYALHGNSDYYRFSQQGLEEVFHRFKKIKSGVASGPGSFLNHIIPHFFSILMPIKILKKLTLYFLAAILWPLKFFDILLAKNKNVKTIAASVYFIGQKI